MNPGPAWLDLLGSPAIAALSVAWLMVLVVLGTLAQADLGLYAAQAIWFESWWLLAVGWVPLPGGRLTMAVMAMTLIAQLGRGRLWAKPGLAVTHGGVLVLLAGGLLVGAARTEGAVVLAEGAQATQMESFTAHELLAIAPDDRTAFRFAEPLLRRGGPLHHPDLAPDLRVEAYHPNVVLPGPGQASLEPAPRAADPSLDRAGARVVIDGQPLTLVAGRLPETSAGGWLLGLRPARRDLPFSVRLLRFERQVHPGTTIPRWFSSEVEFTADGVTRRAVISMNQPLRHGAWTLYQQSFRQGADAPGGATISVLAAVEDRFAGLPYVASALMGLGLAMHLVQRLRPRPGFRP